MNPDGSLTRFGTGKTYFDSDHTSVLITARIPDKCGAWFFGRNDVPIPTYLAEDPRPVLSRRIPRAGDTFWDAKQGFTAVIAMSENACPAPPPPPAADPPAPTQPPATQPPAPEPTQPADPVPTDSGS